VNHDKRHGGPYDRGSADSWYRRSKSPHFYEGGTGNSKRIPKEEMTQEEIEAYNQGYNDNEEANLHKHYEY
jgi:hypothetical protein